MSKYQKCFLDLGCWIQWIPQSLVSSAALDTGWLFPPSHNTGLALMPPWPHRVFLSVCCSSSASFFSAAPEPLVLPESHSWSSFHSEPFHAAQAHPTAWRRFKLYAQVFFLVTRFKIPTSYQSVYSRMTYGYLTPVQNWTYLSPNLLL